MKVRSPRGAFVPSVKSSTLSEQPTVLAYGRHFSGVEKAKPSTAMDKYASTIGRLKLSLPVRDISHWLSPSGGGMISTIVPKKIDLSISVQKIGLNNKAAGDNALQTS